MVKCFRFLGRTVAVRTRVCSGLLMVAALVPGAVAACLSVIPAEAVETLETDPIEHEGVDSDIAVVMVSSRPRCGRVSHHRLRQRCPLVAAGARHGELRSALVAVVAGHRLSNGLLAPLRC